MFMKVRRDAERGKRFEFCNNWSSGVYK